MGCQCWKGYLCGECRVGMTPAEIKRGERAAEIEPELPDYSPADDVDDDVDDDLDYFADGEVDCEPDVD